MANDLKRTLTHPELSFCCRQEAGGLMKAC